MLRTVACLVVALLAHGVASAQALSDNQIEWRVIGRFRLLTTPGGDALATPAALHRSDALMESVYRARQRNAGANWVHEEWQAFAETARRAAFEAGGGARRDDESVQDAHERARHAPLFFQWDRRVDAYDPAYLTPSRYWINATLVGAQADETCEWTLAYPNQSAEEKQTAACIDAVLPVRAQWGERPLRHDGVHRARISVVSSGGRNVALQEISIRDRLVIGVGDSVASGEGNPDIAADWSGLAQVQTQLASAGGPSGAGWIATDEAARYAAGAVWFDEQCHRSLNSWQARVAMAMAADNPHGAVTFATFGCGGASTFDGVLNPQARPPGGQTFQFEGDSGVRSSVAPNGHSVRREVADGVAPRLSQMDAIAHLLCAQVTRGAPIAIYSKVERNGEWTSVPYEPARCDAPMRSVDQLLVTLGGNDIGFAESIVWSVVPRGGSNPVEGVLYRLMNDGMEGRKCPRYNADDPGCRSAAQPVQYLNPNNAAECGADDAGRPDQGRPTSHYLITCFLPFALTNATSALNEVAPRERQTWTAYPAPFWHAIPVEPERERLAADTGRTGPAWEYPNYSWYCGRDGTLPDRVLENGEEESRAMLALYGGVDGAARIPVVGWFFRQFSAPDVGFRIMRWESHEMSVHMHAPLVGRLQGWFDDPNNGRSDRLVDNFLGDDPAIPEAKAPADLRGWCAQDGGTAGESFFPRVRTMDGRHVAWARNFPPWEWDAYTPQRRLFRTPSDSALTQFPGPDFDRFDFGLNEMTRRFSDSISGMLHPNAEMHAILANEAMTLLYDPPRAP